MKKTVLATGELLSFLLMVGNIGVIECEPYPPLSTYLLVVLGIVLMILFMQLMHVELKREEIRKKEEEEKEENKKSA